MLGLPLSRARGAAGAEFCWVIDGTGMDRAAGCLFVFEKKFGSFHTRV